MGGKASLRRVACGLASFVGRWHTEAVPEAGIEALRVVNWDRLRVLCFLDIAALHVIERHGLFGLGLPTFLLLSLCLSVRRAEPLPTRVFIERRVQRLLIPWMVWWLIYAVDDTVHAVRHGEAALAWFEPWMLLYGPKTYLWFMPFIAVAGLAIHFLDRATQKVPLRWLIAGCMVSALAGFWLSDLEPTQPEPFLQWIFAIPALPLALGLGRTLARSRTIKESRRRLIAYLVSSLSVGGLALLVGRSQHHTTVLRYLMGLGTLLVLVLLPQWEDPITPRLQALLLGAYVLHPLIDEQIVDRILRNVLPERPPLLHLVAVVVLTLVWVAWMRRSPLLRRIV